MNSTDSLASPGRALVVVVRGLSPAMIGAYANEWIHTPTLDRLAARGVVCDQHFATDLDPHRCPNEWDDVFRIPKLQTKHFTTTSASPRERHAMFAVRQAVYTWMATLDPARAALAVVETDAILPPWQPSKRLLRFYFGRPENDDSPTPWLDPLPDRVAADDDRTMERLQDTHAAVVTAFDAGLTKLLAGCRKRGFGRSALIAVTADLAFPLGEQGPVGFGLHGVLESVTHLPLILRVPNRDHAGARIGALTEPCDLPVALQEFFGEPVQPSLWPLIRGERETLRDHLTIRCGDETAVRTTDRLLIQSPNKPPRLFLKPEDRWEACDVANDRLDDVEELRVRS